MTLKLIYPTLAMILWIFVVGLVMGIRRKSALASGEVRPEDVAVSSERYPVAARLASANFSNQFELPVVFFALIMLAMEVAATGYAMATLAWIFVASRVVHSLIHIGPNRLPLRGAVYGVGALALLCMWIGVLLAVL